MCPLRLSRGGLLGRVHLLFTGYYEMGAHFFCYLVDFTLLFFFPLVFSLLARHRDALDGRVAVCSLGTCVCV